MEKYNTKGEQIPCENCGFKECNCNTGKKETIKTIKIHLQVLTKAVNKLESEGLNEMGKK